MCIFPLIFSSGKSVMSGFCVCLLFFILIIKISLLCNQSMTTVDNHTDHLIRTAPTDDGGDVGD